MAKKSTAKKTAKKAPVKKAPAKKPVAKPAKKAAKKPGPTKRAATKPAQAKPAQTKPAQAKPAKATSSAASNTAPQGTSIVSTGTGPSPLELGRQFVALFNQGLAEKIEREMYSPDIVSVEGHGVGMAWHGKKMVEAKAKEWMADNIIHGMRAEGPYAGSSGFAIKLEMDVETRSKNTRSVHKEVGVYTVQNGKIVREEFMYGME
jgi:hypothetical protein